VSAPTDDRSSKATSSAVIVDARVRIARPPRPLLAL